MCKIAVMFKPYRSWFTALIQNWWFVEYTQSEFFRLDNLFAKKYILTWVQHNEIFDLYQYLKNNYDDSYKFILSLTIPQLFEENELKELWLI